MFPPILSAGSAGSTEMRGPLTGRFDDYALSWDQQPILLCFQYHPLLRLAPAPLSKSAHKLTLAIRSLIDPPAERYSHLATTHPISPLPHHKLNETTAYVNYISIPLVLGSSSSESGAYVQPHRAQSRAHRSSDVDLRLPIVQPTTCPTSPTSFPS